MVNKLVEMIFNLYKLGILKLFNALKIALSTQWQEKKQQN
jgi:hypothetical protein